MIAEIEALISISKCDPKTRVLKVSREEPDAEGYYYKANEEGVSYGTFGVFGADDNYGVVHNRTGSIVTELLSEAEAARLALLFRKLYDWRKEEVKVPIDESECYPVLQEGISYIVDPDVEEWEVETLLNLVKKKLPKTLPQTEAKEVIESSEAVDFGGEEFKPLENFTPETEEEEAGGNNLDWGTVIT